MKLSTTDLGRFLQERRVELKKRQIEVSEISGMSQSDYSGLETGRKKYLDDKRFQGLVKALKCNPSELRAVTPIKLQGQPKTELAKLIYFCMKAQNLTPEKLAEKIGISADYARALKTRVSSVSLRLAKSLSKALNLEPDVLLKFTAMGRKKAGNEIGELIRTSRISSYRSLDDVAKRLGVKRQTVSAMENGIYKFKHDTKLCDVAEVLNRDPDELRHLKPKRRLKQKEVDPNTSSGFLTIQRLKRELTQKQLEQHVGLTPCTVSRIELGTYEADSKKHRDALDKLLKFFKCEMPEKAVVLHKN